MEPLKIFPVRQRGHCAPKIAANLELAGALIPETRCYNNERMNRDARFVTLVPLVALAALLWIFARPPWTALRIFGLVLAIVGSVVLTIARVQLGNAFSITPQARMLVTRGIYSKIRHPVYVFSALAIAGMVLYVDRPEWLVVFAVLVPLQIVRAKKEEKVLAGKFDGAYAEYKKSTWF